MFTNQDQIIEHLLQLDFDLKGKNLKSKVQFVIFGASAFLFWVKTFRGTSDIDAYFLQRIMEDDVIEIVNSYDVNNQLQHIAGIPEDFLSRVNEVQGFENLEVYVAGTIDLVISKLLRGDMRDRVDVLDSKILDLVEDFDLLRELYNETRDNKMGHPLRFVDIDHIIEEYLERKK